MSKLLKLALIYLVLVKLNELDYEDLLWIISDFSVGRVVFGLTQNPAILEDSEGKSKVAFDRLVNEYIPHAAPSLLKSKSEVHNRKLDLVEKS